ncbi:aminodeoxychorismate/anthranilate synthase component II [Psychrosphaera sp. 1_MG-2023]|uniref:aminodeoxychorismate/anthranilate synthase component II n=1 Tax=Psychrosphaera sp. 1_MG-2023 TaxID=3062643 RepID=UPI0026E33F81|nr:aminodeoxychorismate/anthranilate synthase component II [Psychrosphaera sp. 1_MG-2023]MDO6718071.1 aminodeoxychorismate/anthranilate synthase component II [Psychrosphaera sp. 1_MG-2023]
MSKIYFIDNQDSFTYNLVEELNALELNVEVYRNTLSAEFITQRIENSIANNEQPILFLSPGPGTPSDSPTMMALIAKFCGVIPIIGICLGHQALAEHYGATVDLAGETVHGKSSVIDLKDHEIFNDFGNALQVARYHSLVARDLPSELKQIAMFGDLVMAMVHEQDKTLGFQFHPESILTTNGSHLLKNSIAYLTQNSN